MWLMTERLYVEQGAVDVVLLVLVHPRMLASTGLTKTVSFKKAL